MTVVNLTVDELALGGSAGAAGVVTVDYVAGVRRFTRVDGVNVTLPRTVTVRFTGGVLEAPLDVEPTRGECAALVTIRSRGVAFRRFVEIPDQVSVVFGDLVEVDPVVFTPVSDQVLKAWIEARVVALTQDRF